MIEQMAQKSVRLGKHLVSNTQGASIIIALVFFLICAVVGSVVLTAASINAKAVATHQSTQQREYAVTSAAQIIADQLIPVDAPAEVECTGTLEALEIKEDTIKAPELMTALLKAWNGRTNKPSNAVYVLPDPLVVEVAGHDDLEVRAWVDVDRDFNIDITVSASENRSDVSEYMQVISMQSIPTFDTKGQMKKCQWEKAEISKLNTSGAGF